MHMPMRSAMWHNFVGISNFTATLQVDFNSKKEVNKFDQSSYFTSVEWKHFLWMSLLDPHLDTLSEEFYKRLSDKIMHTF